MQTPQPRDYWLEDTRTQRKLRARIVELLASGLSRTEAFATITAQCNLRRTRGLQTLVGKLATRLEGLLSS